MESRADAVQLIRLHLVPVFDSTNLLPAFIVSRPHFLGAEMLRTLFFIHGTYLTQLYLLCVGASHWKIKYFLSAGSDLEGNHSNVCLSCLI